MYKKRVLNYRLQDLRQKQTKIEGHKEYVENYANTLRSMLLLFIYNYAIGFINNKTKVEGY